MSRFRDEMRKGRAILHRDMGDRAIIFAWPVDDVQDTDDDGNPVFDDDGNPVMVPGQPDLIRIRVRVHEKFLENGDLKGTNYHYAEMEDNSPVAVFWLNVPDGFAPKRDMYFVSEYGRAYRIDSTFPKDDVTQNAKVIELLEKDKVGLPVYTPE